MDRLIRRSRRKIGGKLTEILRLRSGRQVRQIVPLIMQRTSFRGLEPLNELARLVALATRNPGLKSNVHIF